MNWIVDRRVKPLGEIDRKPNFKLDKKSLSNLDLLSQSSISRDCGWISIRIALFKIRGDFIKVMIFKIMQFILDFNK